MINEYVFEGTLIIWFVIVIGRIWQQRAAFYTHNLYRLPWAERLKFSFFLPANYGNSLSTEEIALLKSARTKHLQFWCLWMLIPLSLWWAMLWISV
jgi:hypothetical protein